MSWEKKPAEDETSGHEQLENLEQSADVNPQDKLVWIYFRCGSGSSECGVQFGVQLPRWRADGFIRGEVAKCPACYGGYGTEVLTTKVQLGFCGGLTTIGEITVKCDRLLGHKGRHEHTWERPLYGVRTSTYTWADEGSGSGEEL